MTVNEGIATLEGLRAMGYGDAPLWGQHPDSGTPHGEIITIRLYWVFRLSGPIVLAKTEHTA